MYMIEIMITKIFGQYKRMRLHLSKFRFQLHKTKSHIHHIEYGYRDTVTFQYQVKNQLKNKNIKISPIQETIFEILLYLT